MGPSAAAPLAMPDADMPELFRAADRASLDGQHTYMRSLAIQVCLLVVAGTAAIPAGHSGPWGVDLGGVISAAAFICAAVLGTYILQADPDRTWFEGRAAAESVKTLAWRYAVGGEPFPCSLQPAEADRAFLDSLSGVIEELGGLALDIGEEPGDQITGTMRAIRGSGREERQSAYMRDRIENQRRWYAAKARHNQRQTRRWGLLLLGLQAVGGTAAVLRASGIPIVSLMSAAAAGAVAVTSWTQARQHRTLAAAYGIAALELSTIRSRVETERTEAEWASFVGDAEGAISREHTLWRASRGHRSRPHSPA